MRVATLVNLGSATRIIHTNNGTPVVIETGQVTEPVPISDELREKLTSPGNRDTLILIDDMDYEIPEKIREVLDLVCRMRDGEDSELLRTYGRLMGAEAALNRPNRNVMTARLLEVTREYARVLRRENMPEPEPEPVAAGVAAQPETPATSAPPVVSPPPAAGRRRHRR